MKGITGFTKKQKKMAAFLVIVVISLSYLTYSMVIPRTELSANTSVHFSFSGISMGFQIKNSGTIEINDLTMNVTILNSDDDIEYTEEIEIGSLGRGEKSVHSFTFVAPQRDPHWVMITFDFTSDGQVYNETIEHKMADYMNHNWKDEIKDWRV